MIKVEQMINERGNGAMNQFVLTDEDNDRMIFQSYSSTIVCVDFKEHVITFFEDWHYSRTTDKHRNIFFRHYAHFLDLTTTDGVRKAIQTGTYGNAGVWKVKTA